MAGRYRCNSCGVSSDDRLWIKDHAAIVGHMGWVDTEQPSTVDLIAEIMGKHYRADWSDGTYACAGCRARAEESFVWPEALEDRRAAVEEHNRLYIKPDWTIEQYNRHVAEAIATALTEWLRERIHRTLGDYFYRDGAAMLRDKILGEESE